MRNRPAKETDLLLRYLDDACGGDDLVRRPGHALL